MAIHYNLHRFGPDEFAVGHLINGDLPTNDEERWQIVDAPRYRIQKLLDEHLRAQAALRDCRDSGRPFVLFLRSFSSEHEGSRIEGFVGDQFLTHSVTFQESLKFELENKGIPIIKLHGGSDGFLADMGEEAKVLSTHSLNWKAVASELVQAASVIVFLVSHMTVGVVEEFDLLREFDQMHRCLVVLLDPSQTFVPASDDTKGIRARLADFPNVFELDPRGFGKLYPGNLHLTLTGLLDGARTQFPMEGAIQADFIYLEPGFTDSEDFETTEMHIWRQLRRLRVMFEKTYWGALKSHDIAFQHFTFPGAWKPAHQVYGLAIATADFPAIREALSYLRFLYILRGADFALSLDYLSGQYDKLAAQIFRAGAADMEARYASGPDPLKLPAKIGVAIELFQLAETTGQSQDVETAIYLYQAAVICALRAQDCDDRERRWITANMCDDWAKFQAGKAEIEWAVTNRTFAVTLFRELAAADPDQYTRALGLCLNNLGSLHFARNDFSAANAAFVEALAIRRTTPSASENFLIDLYTSLANLGLLRDKIGQMDSARALYNEALDVCEKRMSSDPAALVELTRLEGLMSLCLAKMPNSGHEALAYAQRAARSFATVSEFSPEGAAALRELVDEALRVTSGVS